MQKISKDNIYPHKDFLKRKQQKFRGARKDGQHFLGREAVSQYQTISIEQNKYFDGGGDDNMGNYITRPEFEEHKRHLDTRFDGISKDIEISKNEVIKTIESDRKADKRWFIGLTIGTGVALLGVIATTTGILLQVFNII